MNEVGNDECGGKKMNGRMSEDTRNGKTGRYIVKPSK